MNTTAERRRIIRADGTTEILPNPVTMAEIEHLIGAMGLDTVNLRDGTVMVVDDTGRARGRPVNPAATRLYWAICRPGTTHQIRGDVVIVPDRDSGRRGGFLTPESGLEEPT